MTLFLKASKLLPTLSHPGSLTKQGVFPSFPLRASSPDLGLGFVLGLACARLALCH